MPHEGVDDEAVVRLGDAEEGTRGMVIACALANPTCTAPAFLRYAYAREAKTSVSARFCRRANARAPFWISLPQIRSMVREHEELRAPDGLGFPTRRRHLSRLGLKGAALAKAQCDTIRLKLLKLAAHVKVTVRNVWVSADATEAVKRCILMTTDPGDLVFDPTCGSGTSAYVAEQWGRRWITVDTGRVALALARGIANAQTAR